MALGTFFLTHWLQYNYWPQGQPFYMGADWPNAFILLVLGPAGWVWSRTKFWPLRPLKHLLVEHRRTHQLIEEIHHLAHTGKEHPRVKARRAEGKHPTP